MIPTPSILSLSTCRLKPLFIFNRLRGEKKISLDIYEARSSVFYMHNHKMIPETNKISNSKKKKLLKSPVRKL